MYLSQAHLRQKFDLSRSTTQRICNYMKRSERYRKGVKVINNSYRYKEEDFVKASNERRGLYEKTQEAQAAEMPGHTTRLLRTETRGILRRVEPNV